MCNAACLLFGKTCLSEEDVEGKAILEVGARDVNGSLRPSLESLGALSYLGVDIEAGPGVDEICTVYDLIERYGAASFDLVVCTEMLEHVRDWRGAISNLKGVLRPAGVLLITTRSIGFPYHGHPLDFWRYEIADMQRLFDDMSIESLQSDPLSPGVFVKARKPESFAERKLESYALYSIIRQKRCRDISQARILRFRAARSLRRFRSRLRRLRHLLPATARTRPTGHPRRDSTPPTNRSVPERDSVVRETPPGRRGAR